MSREIKFRVWDKDKKVWVKYLSYCIDNVISKEWHLISQFTGLKDKKGKEIYEGDILSFEGYPDSIINFDNGSFGYEGVYGFNTLSETNLSIAEVIGNIYETPKLLQS